MALQFPPFKYLHHPKLLVGNPQYADMSFLREGVLHSLYVYVSVLVAHAMADVDGKLEHVKPVLQQLLPKARVCFPVGFRFRRQVEED